MSISDDGRWMFLSTPSGVRMLQLEGADAYVVSLTSSSSIEDLDFGSVNYESGLRETATISGQKWEDLDRDGRFEPGDGEQPIAGFSVYLDLNGNQQWDEAGVGSGQGTVIEPDEFSDEFVLNRHFPGVTLSTTDQNNVPIFKVTANDDPNASTGKFVFGHANIPFWQDTRRLRMDFNSPTRYVAIDFIGALPTFSTTGRLEIYNSTGVLAGTYETQPLFDGQVERMELALADEDISYAVAYVPAGLGNFGRLDNLRFAGPASVSEPLQVTDLTGQYAFDGLQPGTYRVAEMHEPGWQQTYPLGIAKESLLIDVPEVRDHIYDSTREMLLIATSDGKIERFDLSTLTLGTPFNVGAELNGIDLSLDNNYAYVGEVQTSPTVGFVRKVNLDDGTKTNIQFTISGQEGGVKDLAIADNDLGLFSILFNGSGSVPLFELDLGTNATTPRISDLSQHLLINRSLDRSLLVLHGSNGHPDEIFTYDPNTDSFSPSKAVGNVIGSTSAVNHDGSLIAFRSVSGGVSVLDPQLTTMEVYAQLKGGLGFSATGNRFFAIDDDRDELVVYEALSSKPMFSLPLGEDVSGFSTFEPTVLSVTGDGQFLFVTTPSGVRMYDVQEAIPHVITVGYGDHVEGIDFGNMTDGDNRRPTANDDQYEVDEDDELTVAAKGVLTNDDDPDGDTLSAVLLDEPLHGEVTLNADGSFTYTPDPGYFGDDQFEYAASDGNLQSNTATVDITIRALNDVHAVNCHWPQCRYRRGYALHV